MREKGYEGEVTVIPNGFDKEVFSPQLDVELKTKLGLASFVIGYVGNFTLQKGIYNLIEAFAKIKHKNTKLFMIGRGPEKENLIERIKQLGIEDRVVIIDYVEQLKLPIYMSCMDVLVLPSKQMKYAGSKLAKFHTFLTNSLGRTIW